MPTHTDHTDRECFYFVTFTCHNGSTYSSAKYPEAGEKSKIEIFDYRRMTASESLAGDSEGK